MLEVKNLTMHFDDNKGDVEVVHQLNFCISDSEVLGIVGESGSGKTVTALAIAGLGKKGLVIDSGSIKLNGTQLLGLSQKEWSKIQGKDIGMIFQEPMSALNPTMKIGKQVEEALILHTNMSSSQRRKRVLEALEEVELDDPIMLWNKYPHQLSGGMRQRVMIASAMICKPKLLIADEPTTALDAKTQTEILKLLKKLLSRHKTSILFISHNLKVIGELCKRVLVMKNGVVVEEGQVEDVFQNPKNCYTKELINAIPIRRSDILEESLWKQ